jgi:type I restriction enzyme M protein
LPVENFDKANCDIFWLKDESLEESDNLPNPDALAQQIVADLEAASNNSAKSPWI